MRKIDFLFYQCRVAQSILGKKVKEQWVWCISGRSATEVNDAKFPVILYALIS